MLRNAEIKSEGRHLRITKGTTELIINKDTGFVEEFRRGKYPGPYKEVFQFGMTVHGDVAVPAWRFEGEYFAGGLRSFSLRVIDDVDFAAITEVQFAIPVREKEVIVDERRDNIVPIPVQDAISDVHSIDLDSIPKKAIPKRVELKDSTRSWFLYINVAIIFGLVAIIGWKYVNRT
jgi:hypothetical protein